jgi:hypothetical protein
VLYLLVRDMSDPIVNRNDNQYSSTMETTVMDIDTSIFPAHWRHMDDDSMCDSHEVCTRDTYARGGRPDFGSTLAE